MNSRSENSLKISNQNKNTLLIFAREIICAHINDKPLINFPSKDQIFKEKMGVFVTIRIDHRLRGCIGRLDTDKPLSQTIQEMSISAATEDPRFFPMRPEDLSNFQLEISLLTSPKLIASREDIEIGKHGVLIEQAGRRGVLLPQVPVKQNWDIETFLQNVCLKAGLPENSWKEKAKIYTFRTIEFGDEYY